MTTRTRALLVAVGLLLSACGSSSDQTTVDDAVARTVAPLDDGAADDAEVEDAAGRTLGTAEADEAPATTAPSSSTSSTVPDSTVESSTSTSITEDPVDEFDVALDELIAFVEEERGHRFVTRPVVEALDDAAFVAAFADIVREDVAENGVDYVNFTDIYRATGIIGPGEDLESIWMSFADAGAIGFYDSDTERIVLRGDELNALTRTTLVHELVHALDDQIFDIDRPEHDTSDDEIGWTFSALLEGNAGVIENAYRSTMTSAEREEELLLQLSIPGGLDFSAFTSSFLDLQFGRYTAGGDFAEVLWAEGQERVDATFVDPPRTSEQVFDPFGFLAGEEPDPGLPAPPADGAVFEAGVWGQAAWAAVLGDVIDSDDALRAADGWGGDWYVAWRQGDRTCVRVDVAGDTSRDLDELASAIERWATVGDREVYFPTADLVRVTACG